MTSSLPDGPEARMGTEPGKRPRRIADPWTLVLGILGGVLLGTGVTFAILGYVGVFEEPTPPTVPPAPDLTIPPSAEPPPTFGDEVSVRAVAASVVPSTVAVEISSFLAAGSGSGVVYGSDGFIITNHHVVDGAGDVFVVFSDGARYPARVVGSDPVTDIAVLHTSRPDLIPIAVGSPAELVIGQPTVAVGNPLGLSGGPTVTAGIISALDRSLIVSAESQLYGLIQTDAPIAPGSSGGALVDSAGNLIGITTAIAISTVGPADLGFAVPIDIAVSVSNDLITGGEVEHALIGINGETAWAQQDGAEYPVGVLVDAVTPGSAYEEAGGRVNDVIVAVDGQDVATIDALLSQLRRLRAGDVIPVRILRSDAEEAITIEVTLGRLS